MLVEESMLHISKEDAYLIWTLGVAARNKATHLERRISQDTFELLVGIYKDSMFIIEQSDFFSHDFTIYLENPIHQEDAIYFIADFMLNPYFDHKTLLRKTDREHFLSEYKEFLNRRKYTCFSFSPEKIQKFSDDEWNDIMAKVN